MSRKSFTNIMIVTVIAMSHSKFPSKFKADLRGSTRGKVLVQCAKDDVCTY